MVKFRYLNDIVRLKTVQNLSETQSTRRKHIMSDSEQDRVAYYMRISCTQGVSKSLGESIEKRSKLITSKIISTLVAIQIKAVLRLSYFLNYITRRCISITK